MSSSVYPLSARGTAPRFIATNASPVPDKTRYEFLEVAKLSEVGRGMNGATCPEVLQPPKHEALLSHFRRQPAATTVSAERYSEQRPAANAKRERIFICDACQCTIDTVSDAKHLQCAGCDHDLCGGCAARSQRPPKQPLRCPAGHTLMIRAPGAHNKAWMCDGCGHISGSVCEAGCFRCGQCDYDLCSACVARKQFPMPAGLRCPQGHTLKKPSIQTARLQSCTTPEQTAGCRLRSGFSLAPRQSISDTQPSQSAPGSLAIPVCIVPKSVPLDMV